MNFQGAVGDFSSIKKGYNGRYAYGYKERNQLNYNKNGSYLPKTIDSSYSSTYCFVQ